MGFNQRRVDRERATARRVAERDVGVETPEAIELVGLWNRRATRSLRPSFYPTVETVIAAGMPRLIVMYPGCLQLKS